MKFETSKPIMTKQQSGFSLVELMVVVAIIGILATIAVPKFKVFQAKARQAEAKTTLAHIYTLEQAYFGDNDKYAVLAKVGGPAGCTNTANPLGFYIDNCPKSRYSYEVATPNATAFTATATSGVNAANKVMPGCPADIWTMNQNKVLAANPDVTTACNK